MFKSIILSMSCFAVLSSMYISSAEARLPSQRKSPFYVEPYTGYFLGKLEGPSVQNGDLKSYTVGARVGMELVNGAIFGIDYSQGKGKFESTPTGKLDYDQKDLGVFVGYRVHPHVRIYGSYIFRYESEVESVSEFEGDGYNAGISISGIPRVKIGLEYQIRNLNETGGGVTLPGSNSSTTYLLTLRLPLPVPLPFTIR